MFGLNGMKEKLEEAKIKAEETKARMDTVLVEGKSADGKVRVVCSANREVKEITIEDEALNQKGALQVHLVYAVNDALNKGAAIFENEMAAVARETMPNIPGMPNMNNMFNK